MDASRMQPLDHFHLVQYPREVITRSVEKASEMSSSLWAVDPTGTTSGFNSMTGARVVRHVNKHRHSERKSSTAASTTTTVKDHDDQESMVSDSFDVVSNVSSQSPSSSFVITGPTNDIPIEPSQSFPSGHDDLFNLKRENSNLKGQVNSMKILLDEVNKNRSVLQNQVDFLERGALHTNSLVADLEAEKLKVELEREAFRRDNLSLRKSVEELRRLLDDRERDFKTFQAERKAIEEENEELRVRIEKLKLDFDSRRNKEQIGNDALHQQELNLETLMKDKAKLEEKISSLQNELNEVQKLKESSSSQVALLQNQVSEFQRKYIESQSESLSLRRHIDQLEKNNQELRSKQSDLESSSKVSEDDSSSEVDTRSLPPSSADFLKEKAKFAGFKRDSEVNRLRQELNELRSYADQVIANERKINAKHLSCVQRELRERIQEFSSVQSKNKEYESKISSLNISLNCQKEFTESLQKDKIHAETALATAMAKQKELQAVINNLSENNERLEKNLREYAVLVASKDSKIDTYLKDIERLQEKVSRVEEEERNQSSIILPQVKQENFELKAVLEDLKKSLRQLELEKEQYCQQIKQLMHDKTLLEEELVKERTRVTEAPEELEKDKKIRSLEANVKLILRKYHEAVQSKKSLEEKLLVVDSPTHEVNGSTDLHVKTLQEKLNAIEQELYQRNLQIDEKNSLILQLEQEKGEIIRKIQSQDSQEVGRLNETIKQQSWEIEQTKNKLANLATSLEQEKNQAVETISTLKENMEKDQKSLKEARHALFLEKRDHLKSKKDMEVLKENVKSREAAIETLNQELESKSIQLQKLVDSENNLKNELDNQRKLAFELQNKQTTQTSNEKSQTQPLIDQINQYNMLIMEKDQEIERLNLSYSGLQRQFEYETTQLHQSLQQTSQSAEYFQHELNNSRNQIYQLQTEVSQVKGELKTLYESNCRLRSELEKCNIILKDDIYTNMDVIQGILNQHPNVSLQPGHRYVYVKPLFYPFSHIY